MAKRDVEVEIKMPVSKKDFERVRKYLKKNAKFEGSSQGKDVYLNSKYRSFLKVKKPVEYLRVRFGETGGTLNYKYVYNNRKGERTHSDEYETEVSNPQNLLKILGVLGFENLIVVEKFREKYKYQNSFEVDLDKVKKLGYFIEVESLSNRGGVEKTLERVSNFVIKLGLNPAQQDKKGYVYALMEKGFK